MYDTACRAVADAKSVDEVKGIRDKSVAMAVYARQAKNKRLETDAMAIRERAERRLGQMIDEQRRTVGLAKGARGNPGGRGAKIVRDDDKPAHPPTLAELGIDKNLAAKARATAALDGRTFERALSERTKQVQTGGRVLSLLCIAKAIQRKREREAIARAATAAMPVLLSERYRLMCADMRTANQIEPESVDCIVTDPPYSREFLPCWGHLARRAVEWLKPGGSVVMMTGHCFLPEIFAALTLSGLTY